MEKLIKRIEQLQQALTTLEESLLVFHKASNEVYYVMARDSVIVRFNYCYDLFWKSLKGFIEQEHGIIVDSPNKIFREAVALKLISIETGELLIAMIFHRNTTTHRYSALDAEEIAKTVQTYYEAMVKIVEQMLLQLP